MLAYPSLSYLLRHDDFVVVAAFGTASCAGNTV